MKDHKISWLNMPGYKGETWNPIVGCSKISEGCDNCYAEKMAVRLKGMNIVKYQKVIENGQWSGKTDIENNIIEPLAWKKPRMIFVCSMGDLFHDSVSTHWQRLVFKIISTCPQHIFIVLTKRPENAYKFFQQYPHFERLPNVWFGLSAACNEDIRGVAIHFKPIKAAVKFISVEPLIAPLDLDHFSWIVFGKIRDEFHSWNEQVDWVICGGETGPKARPMHPDWVRSLRDQCKAAQVPFFFKQWGEWVQGYGFFGESTKKQMKYAHGSGFTRIGHKAAGRLLDGVEYNEFPEVKS